ncbi:MAG: YggS family pyridoxal phosphate-dependent enzyme, partial [Acidobacteriota bacterium]|nr:YggS family pyridoxal phosphate-dependent enzyme [Acidobacteriota bacterium]
MYEHISGRLAEVRNRIADAAGRAGRAPDSVRLIAVSKTHPIDAVRAAAEAGQLDFGENKVQEALQKITQSADTRLRW